MIKIIYKVLPSGWIRFSYGSSWAQLPPGFSEETIPVEFIFDPDSHRTDINIAWRAWIKEHKEK